MAAENVTEISYCPPDIAWTTHRLRSSLSDEHTPITQKDIDQVNESISNFNKLRTEEERKVKTRILPSFDIEDLSGMILVDSRALEFDGQEIRRIVANYLTKSAT